MLENVTVRSFPGTSTGISSGSLAELLLFYGSVHLILDFGRLGNLLRIIGPENLDFLIANKFLKVTYSLSQSGVRTERSGPFEVHDFVEFQLGGTKPKTPTATNQIKLIYDRVLPDHPRRGYFANKLIDASEKLPGLGDASKGSNASALARASILDDQFLNRATRVLLQTLLPNLSLPGALSAKAFQVHGGYAFDSNLNFEAINREYHKIVPPSHSSITPAYLLDFIWQSSLDLNLSARYGTDLLTGEISSKLIELKFGNILNKVTADEQSVRLFSDFAFHGRTIKETINSGERTFDEFRDVLVKSRNFREWLRGINPDADILREYHNASVKGTWVEKLPTKSARFAVFTGAGIAVDVAFPTGLGTAMGMALGAADTFLLDRLIGGWKPNHFVEDVLEDFVQRPE